MNSSCPRCPPWSRKSGSLKVHVCITVIKFDRNASQPTPAMWEGEEEGVVGEVEEEEERAS